MEVSDSIYSDIKFDRALEVTFPRETGIPTLHLIFGKVEGDSTAIGLCLDFGHLAHSDNADKKEMYAETISTLLESSISYIFSLQRKDLLDNLYQNKVRDEKIWSVFTDLNDARKVRVLKKSFVTKKVPSGSPQVLWDIDDDFPSLNKIGKDQLIHWLDQLSKSTPQGAQIILGKMISSIFDRSTSLSEVSDKIAS